MWAAVLEEEATECVERFVVVVQAVVQAANAGAGVERRQVHEALDRAVGVAHRRQRLL